MNLKPFIQNFFTWIYPCLYNYLPSQSRGTIQKVLGVIQTQVQPNLLMTEGLEGALYKSQFDTLLNVKGDKVRNYQELQSAAKSGEEMISTAPLWTQKLLVLAELPPLILARLRRALLNPAIKTFWALHSEMVQGMIWMMSRYLWMVILMKISQGEFSTNFNCL